MILANTFQIDIITIIFIVALIGFTIFGAITGVFKMLLHLGGNIVSALISLFLAKPLGMFVYNLGVYNYFIDKATQALEESTGIFTQIITNENKSQLIKASLEQLNIPSIFNSIISDIGNAIIPTTNGHTIANYLSESLFVVISIILTGLVLFGILKLILIILKLFLKKLDEIKIIGRINHLAGALIGFLSGIMFIIVSMIIITGLMMVPTFNYELSRLMYLDDDQVWTFSKWLYEINIVAIILKLLGLG